MTTPAPRRHLLTLSVLAATLAVGSTTGAVAGSVITGQQIKNGTITSLDVKDRSLQAKDVAAPVKASFTTIQGYERIRVSTPVPATSSGSVDAPCPSNKRVIGGGAFFGSTAGTQFVINPQGTIGSAYGYNPSADSDDLVVDIVCAFVGAVKVAAGRGTSPRGSKR